MLTAWGGGGGNATGSGGSETGAVAEGAQAYLKRQYITIAIVGAVVFVGLWILLGAVAAWAAAVAGGRHRDGAALPEWIVRSNAIGRRHEAVYR